MKRILVFHTAFNTFTSNKLTRKLKPGNPHPITTVEWTKNRLDIWQRFTLKSILNQDHRDFIYVLLLDPELRTITDPLLPKLDDDRIIFSYEDEPLIRSLREYDELVLAFLDSDDMYARDAGTLMMSCSREWMYFKVGYALDVKGKQLCLYDTKGSGPFYAQRLPGKKLIEFNRKKNRPYHEHIVDFKPARLPDFKFCVVIHGENTSSSMKISFIKEKTFGLRALGNFGINMED
jgi:hypothetical protein